MNQSRQSQSPFNLEPSNMSSLIRVIQHSLTLHQLTETYSPEQILAIAWSVSKGQMISGSLPLHQLTGSDESKTVVISDCCMSDAHQSTTNSSHDLVSEIKLSWLKTNCLEIIKNLRQQRENRLKFDIAIQALFDMNNPDSQSTWATVRRILHQFRLSGTYEVREIIAEAYSIGVKRIESGTIIENPLAWLRTTCLYVIRDFRRKQDKLDKPKLDSEGLTVGDEVLSNLVIAEDRKAIQLAVTRLTPEEQQILCARVLQGLSWQAIGESLSCSKQAKINTNAARQRGFRALKKLREHYEVIRQEVEAVKDGFEE